MFMVEGHLYSGNRGRHHGLKENWAKFSTWGFPDMISELNGVKPMKMKNCLKLWIEFTTDYWVC